MLHFKCICFSFVVFIFYKRYPLYHTIVTTNVSPVKTLTELVMISGNLFIYHRLQNINFVSQLKEELCHSNPAWNIATMKISEDLQLARRRVPDSYIG